MTDVPVPEPIHYGQARSSPDDLKRYRRECWRPGCPRRAWLRDWAGWHWCGRDWYRSARWGGGRFWFDLKTVRIKL